MPILRNHKLFNRLEQYIKEHYIPDDSNYLYAQAERSPDIFECYSSFEAAAPKSVKEQPAPPAPKAEVRQTEAIHYTEPGSLSQKEPLHEDEFTFPFLSGSFMEEEKTISFSSIDNGAIAPTTPTTSILHAAPKPHASFSPSTARSFQLDESFSHRVQRLMVEKGLTAPQCYQRANIDRRLFSRICCKEDYHPRKNTALALAVALELTLDETNELLKTAGYSLSHSILTDVIVEYFITERFYDILVINEVLYDHDAMLLGT